MANKLNGVRTSEDILLATPRTGGVIFNTANNIFNTITNPLTRGVNYLNDRYRKSIERVTKQTYSMKEYTEILESDKFKQRLSKRWGNHKTRWVNKFRQTGNLWVKGLGVAKSALWTVPLAWNMTITNAGDTLKDLGTTVGGAFHDVGKAVVAPADQGPDKQQFQYTKVQRDRLAWLKPVANPTPVEKAVKPTPQPKKEEPKNEEPAPAPTPKSVPSTPDKQPAPTKEKPTPAAPKEKPASAAKTYSGLVSKTPQPHQVFVFGSNQYGAHGGGNAEFAKTYWKAIDGNPEGLQGQAYGIVTTLKQPDPSKPGEYINTPNPPTEVVKQIQKLYTFAKANHEREFLIGYTEKGGAHGSGKSDEPMLSGYSPIDLATLFLEAAKATGGSIPENIIFNDKFAELVNSGKKKA